MMWTSQSDSTARIRRLLEGELRGRIIRFGLVGGGATLVHSAIFLVLVDMAGVSPTVATVPAFLCAFVFSYRLNHSWTFRKHGEHGRYLTRYGVIAATGVLLNIGLMYTLTAVMAVDHHIALAVVVVAVPAFSFLANVFWGFR